MLTSGQCRLAAYLTDGGVICVECGNKRMNLDGSEDLDRDQMEQAEENASLRPLIQYELDSDESFQESGLLCDDCDSTLVDPVNYDNVGSEVECVTCGDVLDPNDKDNFVRPEGFNKAGRTDCGKCVRGMKRTSN